MADGRENGRFDPDDGNGEPFAKGLHADCGCRIAGKHDCLDVSIRQVADDPFEALHDVALIPVAVRRIGAVGGKKDALSRKTGSHRTRDGKAAES